MVTTVETPNKIWTEGELERLPEDGFLHEVVAGELVMSPKNNFQHGNITSRLFLALGNHVQQNRLGVVLDSSTGFWMKNRNCRAPDISFVSTDRLSGWKASAQHFFAGAPDLAVEILSPNNTRAEIDARLKDFFESGTRLAWVIDPNAEHAEVFRAPAFRDVVGKGGVLEATDLLPGFRYPIDDLFKAGDWE